MTAARDGKHYRACNLCEAICGLEITVENGRIVDLRGDADDVFSHGHICPKGNALIDLHEDPDRLKRPLVREGTQWREIAWDEAYALVAERLKAVAAAHGNDAIAVYFGNPTVHNSGSYMTQSGFTSAFKTKNVFSATSVDQLPHHLAAIEMFGHPLLMPVPDVDRTDYFLCMGANPMVSNGSIMTAPNMRERLRAIRARGGKIVVVDPRRTETAAVADEHYFIRPGTDAAFLLALLHVVFAEELAHFGRLEALYDGKDALRDVARPFAPENVAGYTGIAAETIRRIARDYATAERAAAYGRVGLSTQPFGTLCQWLLNALNAATAHLDEPGGAMLPHPAVDLLMLAKRGDVHRGRRQSRVRNLPEIINEFPVATLADEILTPGEGQVRALVTVAGNPVLSTPGGARLDGALAQLDFMVSVDPFLNETTRHAHVVLPPAVGLENEHYDAVFYHLAVRDTARYNDAIFPIGDDQRYDWQIFSGLRKAWDGKALQPARERIDLGLRMGPRKTSIEELRAHPHGVDYGPLTPSFPERVMTADGRINLAPEPFVRDVARLAAEVERPAPGLVLVGRRQLRGNNSWMHNAPRLMRGRDRCTLQINPHDAAAHGVHDGDPVEVRSRAGSAVAPAELTDEVMPGVLSLPHGFGHGRAGTRLRVAAEHPGASLNDVTDEQRLDELSGNAALNGVPVEIRVLAPAPA